MLTPPKLDVVVEFLVYILSVTLRFHPTKKGTYVSLLYRQSKTPLRHQI